MFQKAQRKKAKLRLGISGPSGSGKTWSALEIATGLGGQIAMIDTEAGRGELYGSDFEYDVMRLDAPYSPEKYIAAIKAAETAGYSTLIIDSLSHAWVGEGGVLSIVEKAGGQFHNGWKTATPKQNALVDAIITSKLHIIVTLRTKTEYVVEMNDKGKQAPRKIGLSPVQRDGLEYEFTVFMDINQDHIAHVTKDNTKLFDQQYIKPDKKMGELLIEWLNSGIDIAEQFRNEKMPEIIFEIHKAENMDKLREIYLKAHQEYLHKFPEDFKKITEAKDKKKQDLDKFNNLAESLNMTDEVA